MERIVIVGYRPKPGKADALRIMLHSHVPRLRAEGLVSDRAPILMEAGDETFIEVFGWKSKEALESAHRNPAVQAMWAEYAAVCDYVPVGSLAECQGLFADFTPVTAAA